MKKIILAMSILAISTAVTAQTEITFGAKGGLTAANMHTKGSFMGESINETSGTKIGFYAGGFAEVGFSESLSIQPELVLSIMGGTAKEDSKYKSDLAYVNIPVLAKYNVNSVSLYLGPQIGFLMSANAKYEGEKESIKDSYKSTDFSAVVGAGYTLESGLGFDARYQMGLSSVAKDVPSSFTQKNNAFTFGLHYKFNQN